MQWQFIDVGVHIGTMHIINTAAVFNWKVDFFAYIVGFCDLYITKYVDDKTIYKNTEDISQR